MRYAREMPAGFAEDAVKLSQEELRKKYHAGTTTIQRWRHSLGHDRESIMAAQRAMVSSARCSFNPGLDCCDKSHCSACGWNPDERERRQLIFQYGGMRAMREYVLAQERACAVV